MSRPTLFALTTLALLAFAGNSLLCRLALREGAIDAASFTTVRLLAGAAALVVLVGLRRGRFRLLGSWPSALALFGYAAGFSLAYRGLSAATGALLLFAAVQATMTGWGLVRGERLHAAQWGGLVLAGAGLGGLLLPGLAAPAPLPALLMLGAGLCWGAYSLRGRGAGDPLAVTAGNFLRATLPALLLVLAWAPGTGPTPAGLGYAIASGALTSGIGYAIWYRALPQLSATRAATVQLAVPVLAAAGGVLLLGETPTLRLALAAAAILGGIALVVGRRPVPR